MSGDSEPNFIVLDETNIDDHHICCALGDPKHVAGVEAKKKWMKKRFSEGLVFRKLDVRGKAFIEYMPAETAWRPIIAPGWLVIHCFWVSGRFAGHGYARTLLDGCLNDAKRQGKHGVVVAVSKKKRPFLGERRFFEHFGFKVVDSRGEYLLLACQVSNSVGAVPRFDAVVQPASAQTQRDIGKSPKEHALVMRFTDQCPFNPHWSEKMASRLESFGFDVSVERLTSRAKAQKVASPLGAFGLEHEGELLTHFLQADSAVDRLVQKLSEA